MAETESSIGQGFWARVAEGVKASLYKDPKKPEEMESAARPEELPALTPVGKPPDGPARLLYGIAFDPSNEEHPMRKVSQELFANAGEIPGDVVAQFDTAVGKVSGVLEPSIDGSVINYHVKIVFDVQNQMHEAFTAPQVIPSEGFDLKTIRAVSVTSAVAD